MAELSPRDVVELYARALKTRDLSLAPAVFAEELVEDYPQSGERIVGLANWLAILRYWPEQEKMESGIDRVVGSEDRWVLGPTWAVTHIIGTGDDFWATGHVTYPDGSRWHLVQLLHVKGGRIDRMTSYFAEPFPPAEWRKPYVQQMPGDH